MMPNPWIGLPHDPPFVLPEDAEAVRAFNARASEKTKLRIDEFLPEPFVGNRNAPVVVLGNNPGYSAEGARLKSERGFAACMRANLQHAKSEFPLVFLSPTSPGPTTRWWEKKLRGLMDIDRAVLA